MTDLIPIEQVNAIELFTGGGLNGLLKQIESAATDFEPDLESVTGRKEVAAQAYKVRQSKVVIDNAGKEVVADWKKKAKIIDEGRKQARDFLDDLAARIRAPLTALEEEEKRREAEELEAKKLALEIMKAHDEALREDEIWEREREVREQQTALQAEKDQLTKEAAERAAKEREDQIRKEAAEAAQKAAEQKAATDLKVAEERAQKAAQEAEQAAAREREKMEAEKRAEEEAKRKREADRVHRAKVNTAALNGLLNLGIDSDCAKACIVAIAKGQVPNVTINY